MIINKKNKSKKAKDIVSHIIFYMLSFILTIVIFTPILFVSYKKIIKQQHSYPQARVMIVEDEITIEYKEIKNENNID